MTKPYLIITILALSIGCNTQTTQAPVMISDQDTDVLTNIKMVLLKKAYDEQDTTLLGQLLHEKYQLVDDGGLTYSKNDEMNYVLQYGPSLEQRSSSASSEFLFAFSIRRSSSLSRS